MSSAHELGLSADEFNDALLLTRVYQLCQNARTCPLCFRAAKITHYELGTAELMCEHCARKSSKKLGDHRLTPQFVARLETKYKRAPAAPPAPPAKLPQNNDFNIWWDNETVTTPPAAKAPAPPPPPACQAPPDLADLLREILATQKYLVAGLDRLAALLQTAPPSEERRRAKHRPAAARETRRPEPRDATPPPSTTRNAVGVLASPPRVARAPPDYDGWR